MKVRSLLSLTSVITLSLILTLPEKNQAQANYGPNLGVGQRECPPANNRDCQAETFRENTLHNRQIYFQTPEKILQNFHRDRTQRACLERTITTPPPPVDQNCPQLLERVESLQQQAPVVDLRELQQREIDNLYPNLPK